MADQPPPGRQLIGFASVALFSNLSQSLSRFVINWLIGRLGGPSLLGSFSSVISVSLLLVASWPASNAAAATKHIAYYSGKRDAQAMLGATRHAYLRAAQSTAVLLCAVLPLMVFNNFMTLPEAICCCAATIGLTLAATARAVRFGFGEVKSIAQVDGLQSIAVVAATIALLVIGVRSVWLVLVTAAGQVAVGLFLFTRRGTFHLAKTAARRIDRFAMISVLGSFASAGFLQLAVVMARATAGPSGTGIFSAALILATPITLVAAAVAQGLFPVLARTAGSGTRASVIQTATLVARALSCWLLIPVAWCVFSGDRLVRLIWGPQYAEATPVFALLVGAFAVNAIASPAVQALTAGTQKGMYATMASSQLGMVVGLAWWFTRGGQPLLEDLALGYFLGMSGSALSLCLVLWRLGHGSLPRQILFAFLCVISVLIARTVATDERAWSVGLIWTILFLAATSKAQIGLIRKASEFVGRQHVSG